MEVIFNVRMCLYICGFLPVILKIVYGQTIEMPNTSTLATDDVTVTDNRNVTTNILPTAGVIPDNSTGTTNGVNITDNDNVTAHVLPTTTVTEGGIPDTSTVATDGINVTDNKNVTTQVLTTTTFFEDQPNYLFLIGVPLASSIVFFLTLVICVCLLSILFNMKKQRELQIQLNYAWDDDGDDETHNRTIVEEGVIMEGNVRNADLVDSTNRGRRSDIRNAYFSQSSYRRGSEF